MSKIQTKKQLLKEISSLVDDYINHCLNKKPSYEFKIDSDNEKEIKTQETQEVHVSKTHEAHTPQVPQSQTSQLPQSQPPQHQPQTIQHQTPQPQTIQPQSPQPQTIQSQAPPSQQMNTHEHSANECCSHGKCGEPRVGGGESEESDDPIKMLSEMANPHAPFDEHEVSSSTKKKKVPAKVTKKQAANIEGRKEAKADVESSKKKCVGLLTNWKRCTRDRDPSAADPELCSFHNNPKFIGKIEKLDLKDIHEESTPTKQTNIRTKNTEGDAVYLFNPASDGAVLDPTLKIAEIPDPLKNANNNVSVNIEDDSHESDDVQVFIRRDEDGDFVDQDANIWDVKDKKIIGKKDLMTKQKIFFQKI